MITNNRTHPWQVAVYVGTTTTPVRVFDRYCSEQDAEGFAEVLRSQAKRSGFTHVIRVERTPEDQP